MPAPLDALHAALAGAPEVLILPHTNPDPDAIASAVALRALLVHQGHLAVRVGYRGIIGRAENRALVRYLGHPLRRVRLRDIQEAAAVVLVDTQPGAGNCAAQPTAAVRAVIDHHPARGAPPRGAFVDLRPTTGATATIVTEYLQATDVPLTRPLATALFYGIKSDTLGLIRDTSAADIAAYLYLQPQIDPAALMAIEQAPVPVSYFRQLNAAIQAAHVYEDGGHRQPGAPDLSRPRGRACGLAAAPRGHAVESLPGGVRADSRVLGAHAAGAGGRWPSSAGGSGAWRQCGSGAWRQCGRAWHDGRGTGPGSRGAGGRDRRDDHGAGAGRVG